MGEKRRSMVGEGEHREGDRLRNKRKEKIDGGGVEHREGDRLGNGEKEKIGGGGGGAQRRR